MITESLFSDLQEINSISPKTVSSILSIKVVCVKMYANVSAMRSAGAKMHRPFRHGTKQKLFVLFFLFLAKAKSKRFCDPVKIHGPFVKAQAPYGL